MLRDRSRWPGMLVAIGTFIALVGVLFVLIGSGVIGTAVVSGARALVWLGILEMAVGAGILLVARRRRPPSGLPADPSGWAALISALIDWNQRDDSLTTSQRARALVLVSALGLFLELVLIRLLGAEIKVFAFLKNVVLLGAFLGLGLGFFLARRREGWLPLLLPA